MGFFARFRSALRHSAGRFLAPLARAAAAVAAPLRRALGAPRAPIYPLRAEWYLGNLVSAMRAADTGMMRDAAQLAEAFSVDGRISGLLGTRAEGLLRLPQTWTSDRGETPLARWLREDWSRLVPRDELSHFIKDRIKMGFAIGELIDAPGGGIQFNRLPPEFVQIIPTTGEIFYLGEPVTPGNGRWVVWTSTAIAPWRNGIWPALGRAFIAKDHAYFLRENFSMTLANPARVIEVPEGDTDDEMQEFYAQVAAWSANTVFALRPGHKISIAEANGQGYQVFQNTMEAADADVAMAICGNVVTSEGANGFFNPEVFNKIQGNLIAGDGEVANVITSQVIPWWQREEAVSEEERRERITWWIDTEDPRDRMSRLAMKTQGINTARLARESGYSTDEIDRIAGLLPASVGGQNAEG